jgi:hypothetical protein
MANVEIRVMGNPYRELRLAFSRTRVNLDNAHNRLLRELQAEGRFLMDRDRLRPQERGVRPDQRGTGRLFGSRNVVKGTINARGSDRVVGKGFTWPDTRVLNRRAPHWRAIEFGLDSVTMPAGLFVNEGGGDVFRLFREVDRSDFESDPSRIRRGRYGAIEAKHIFERAWNEVITEENVTNHYVDQFRRGFTGFKVRFS